MRDGVGGSRKACVTEGQVNRDQSESKEVAQGLPSVSPVLSPNRNTLTFTLPPSKPSSQALVNPRCKPLTTG